jgi:hypothetical protein
VEITCLELSHSPHMGVVQVGSQSIKHDICMPGFSIGTAFFQYLTARRLIVVSTIACS